jgi:hypothetical protein
MMVNQLKHLSNSYERFALEIAKHISLYCRIATVCDNIEVMKHQRQHMNEEMGRMSIHFSRLDKNGY